MVTIGTLGFPGALIYFSGHIQGNRKSDLHTSCLQAYPIFELNPLLEKLIFNVWEYFEEPGTLALLHRSLPGANIPNLEDKYSTICPQAEQFWGKSSFSLCSGGLLTSLSIPGTS